MVYNQLCLHREQVILHGTHRVASTGAQIRQTIAVMMVPLSSASDNGTIVRHSTVSG